MIEILVEDEIQRAIWQTLIDLDRRQRATRTSDGGEVKHARIGRVSGEGARPARW